MSDTALSRFAVAVFAVTAAMLAAAGAFSLVHGWHGDAYAPVFYVVWATVGLVLAVRRPRNAIGWLFLAAAASWSASGLAGHYGLYGLETRPGSLPAPVLAFWVATWIWLPGLLLLPTLGLLLFPEGRLPSPRWRWPARAAGTGVGLAMLAYTVVPWQGNDEFPAVPAGAENPLRASAALTALHDPLLAVALLLILAGIVAGVAALVVRYRRARSGERQQLKWAVAGGIASVAVYLTGELTTRLPGVEWWLVTLVAAVVFPVTILVAVLRYRLYDIDRIVSRTVSYVVLTALLAGLYVAGVVGFGGLVRSLGGGGGDLVVAASTLAVAALFGPARRRIQAVVDRRFNRARYDAQRTVEVFAYRLRDEVDLDALAEQLRSTARVTMHPRGVSLWLRAGEAGV